MLAPLIKLKKDDGSSTGIGGLKEQPASAVAPFWLVTEGDLSNMVLKHVATKMGVNIPVLTNSKALVAGDQLCASPDTMAALAGKKACAEPKKKVAKMG